MSEQYWTVYPQHQEVLQKLQQLSFEVSGYLLPPKTYKNGEYPSEISIIFGVENFSLKIWDQPVIFHTHPGGMKWAFPSWQDILDFLEDSGARTDLLVVEDGLNVLVKPINWKPWKENSSKSKKEDSWLFNTFDDLCLLCDCNECRVTCSHKDTIDYKEQRRLWLQKIQDRYKCSAEFIPYEEKRNFLVYNW
jgi:hypothetical protein